MSVKRILMFNNEEDRKILQSKSMPVIMIDDEIKDLIQDMKDTLLNTQTGVGLSAVQIGSLKQICVIKYCTKLYTLINPIITRRRGEIIFNEGCLSVPGVFVNVPRSQKVWVTYMDENGETQQIDQGGLFSVIVQHELDHFKGTCAVEESIIKEEKGENENENISNRSNENGEND